MSIIISLIYPLTLGLPPNIVPSNSTSGFCHAIHITSIHPYPPPCPRPSTCVCVPPPPLSPLPSSLTPLTPPPRSSVNSAHSSASRSSGGSQTHSPSSSCRYRSLAQPPPGGAHRLSSVSSHDSGFISQDANVYSKPPSPMPSDITSQVRHGDGGC